MAKPQQNVKETAAFLSGKARRRLIENEEIGAVGERPCDCHQLPIGAGEFAEITVERQGQTGSIEHRLRRAANAGARDEEGGVSIGETVEKQGVGNGQAGRADQIRRLMHGDDTGPCRFRRAARREGAAIETDSAAIGRLYAGKDFDQRRLTCTVCAHERHNLAALDHKIGAGKRSRRAKATADIFNVKKRHRQDPGLHLYQECASSGRSNSRHAFPRRTLPGKQRISRSPQNRII